MSEAIKKFIIQEIEKLSEKFPQISFKYGFDKMGKQHLIEVEPDTEYKNPEYMEAEFDVIDAFIFKFPDDEILFISNNKYIHIERVVYIKEGVIQVTDDLIGKSYVFQNEFVINAPFSFEENTITSLKNQITICAPLPVNKNNFVETESNNSLVNENNYAMAA